MKVWLCSEGEYSDYKPKAIYTDKETAVRMTAAYGWRNDPIEYELDPELPEEARAGMSYFRILMWENGDVRWVETTEPNQYSINSGLRDAICPEMSTGRTGREIQAYCWARDETHAVKIANDRRAQLLALELPEHRDERTR